MDVKPVYWKKQTNRKNDIQGFTNHMYININPYP